MKKPWFVFLVFALVIASCNMPGATSTETPIESANTAESIPTATDIASAPSNEFATSPAEKLLQLDHHPLYWFAPLPPLSVNEGRPFIGSEDFMTLFNNDADWHNAVEHIQVFKLYGEWVAYQATDEELRIVIENLKQRGLALAVEAGPLNASAECGQNIEGFAGIEEGIRIAKIACGSTSAFIFAITRAGRPARACPDSRSSLARTASWRPKGDCSRRVSFGVCVRLVSCRKSSCTSCPMASSQENRP
jgi:hypothetical protein